MGGFIDVMLRYGAFDLAAGRMNYWGTGDEPFHGEVVTNRGVAAEYERLSGKKLQQNRLGSLDDLARWIAEKKKTAKSPLEYVFGQYAWGQLTGKAALTDLVNGWYPDFKPATVREVIQKMLAR